MSSPEQNISNILSILDAKAENQVAFYQDQICKRLQGAKAAVLWDWNNTLVDNFWVRLNMIRARFERSGGHEIEIFEDIYKQAEASITIATGKLDDYYRGIIKFCPEVNKMMEDNVIETPIKDPQLPAIIQEMELAGIRSVGIITGSKQSQLPIMRNQLMRYYPSLEGIPFLMYPEFTYGESFPLPRDYKYTLMWKSKVAEKLSRLDLSRIDFPIFIVDNEPKQADLINTGNGNIFGVHFDKASDLRQQIEQYIS